MVKDPEDANDGVIELYVRKRNMWSKRLFLPSEPVKVANILTCGSVHGRVFCEISVPPCPDDAGGTMIPHLQNISNIIHFRLARTLTGN